LISRPLKGGRWMSNLHSDPPLADRFTNEYGAFGNLFKEAALVKRGL